MLRAGGLPSQKSCAQLQGPLQSRHVASVPGVSFTVRARRHLRASGHASPASRDEGDVEPVELQAQPAQPTTGLRKTVIAAGVGMAVMVGLCGRAVAQPVMGPKDVQAQPALAPHSSAFVNTASERRTVGQVSYHGARQGTSAAADRRTTIAPVLTGQSHQDHVTAAQHHYCGPPLAVMSFPSPLIPSNWNDVTYRLNYRILQLLTLPTYGKVAALVLVGVPLLLGGAALYHRFVGADWEESLNKSYWTLMDVPGMDVTSEHRAGRLVLQAVQVASMFTFAVVVGVFCEDISAGVEALRTGNFRVPEEGHTVLIGWDGRRTPLLIQQLLEAQKERGRHAVPGPLVVLIGSEASKEDVDAELAECLGNKLGQVVVTRQGSAMQPGDLERVGAGRASTVIYMPTSPLGAGEEEAEEGALSCKVDPATHLVASLAALHSVSPPAASEHLATISATRSTTSSTTSAAGAAHSTGRGPAAAPRQQTVVVSLPDAGPASWGATPAGRAVSQLLEQRGRHVTTLTIKRELTDMLAYTALNPGLSAVFEQVCMQRVGGMEFYVHGSTDFTGRTFCEARRSFPTAVVCGTVNTVSHVSRLNPPDDYVISHWDRLVLLSGNALSALQQHEAPVGAPVTPVPDDGGDNGRTDVWSHPHVVVILQPGCLDGAAQMVLSLADVSQGTAHITLVGREPKALSERQSLQGCMDVARRAGCGVHWVKHDFAEPGCLAHNAKAGTAHAVVIPPPGPEWAEADADAQVVSCALQLVDLLSQRIRDGTPPRNTPLRLVSSVSGPRMRTLLAGVCHACCVSGTAPGGPAQPVPQLVVETLLEDNLMSGLLGQVAVEPLLQGVFAELLSADGAELYTRDPSHYGLAVGAPAVPWARVCEAVRARGDIALGVVRAAQVQGKGEATAQLGPAASELIALGPRDRLVVLADD